MLAKRKLIILSLILAVLSFSLFITSIKKPLACYKYKKSSLALRDKKIKTLNQLKTKMNGLTNMPASTDIPQLAEAALKESDINLEHIEIRSTDIQISAKSTYDNIKKFFHQISKNPNPFVIQSISLSPTSSASTITLHINLLLNND